MATKLKVNYEFVGDSTTPVTRTNSIKHGDKMLDTVINNLENYVTPQMFGAKGDGVTDDTSAINQALNNGGNIVFPDGDYLINGITTYESPIKNVGLVVKSNTRIILNRNAVIHQTGGTNTTRSTIFSLVGVENVEITGGKLIGDADTHVYDVHSEWGHAISIIESKNIYIHGMEICKCVGDGVYIGQGTRYETSHYNNNHCSNVVLDTLNIHDCGRNGISMCDCNKWTLSNLVMDNINRVAPKSGIDVEPEGDFDPFVSTGVIKNLNCTNSYCAINFSFSYEIVECSDVIGRIVIYDSTNVNVHNSNCPLIVQKDSEIVIHNSTISSLASSDDMKKFEANNCEIVLYGDTFQGNGVFRNCIFDGGILIKGDNILNGCLFKEANKNPVVEVYGKRCEMIGCRLSFPVRKNIIGIIDYMDAESKLTIKDCSVEHPYGMESLTTPMVMSGTRGILALNNNYAPFDNICENLKTGSANNYSF